MAGHINQVREMSLRFHAIGCSRSGCGAPRLRPGQAWSADLRWIPWRSLNGRRRERRGV